MNNNEKYKNEEFVLIKVPNCFVNENGFAMVKSQVDCFNDDYFQAEELCFFNSENKKELLEIRNNLYDNIPIKNINAFDLIKLIKEHLEKLDEFLNKNI